MKLERKTRSKVEIPTASMPDIIFMLLIFFMVTTVMREYDGLDVLLPRAQEIQKLESKREITHVWARKDGVVSINDHVVPVKKMRQLFYAELVKKKGKMTVSLEADQDAPMKLISDIHTEMREVNALRLSYATLRKGGNNQ